MTVRAAADGAVHLTPTTRKIKKRKERAGRFVETLSFYHQTYF